MLASGQGGWWLRDYSEREIDSNFLQGDDLGSRKEALEPAHHSMTMPFSSRLWLFFLLGRHRPVWPNPRNSVHDVMNFGWQRVSIHLQGPKNNNTTDGLGRVLFFGEKKRQKSCHGGASQAPRAHPFPVAVGYYTGYGTDLQTMRRRASALA